MTSLKIHEQIAFLRRQKGLTQEELARALGVSNQAVSKWEAGQCCPDIGLLPDIAALFGVTIDQLMGYGPAKSFDRLYLDIKAHFEQLPEADCFDRAFRLAVLLHEAACSKGYKARLPWSAEKNHGLESGPFPSVQNQKAARCCQRPACSSLRGRIKKQSQPSCRPCFSC